MSDKHTEFLKAYNDYPSQDNEGYVPDRAGFKCGFSAAWELKEKENARLKEESVHWESEAMGTAHEYAKYMEAAERVIEAAAAIMETAECRGDEDCDHCVLWQALNAYDSLGKEVGT